jgi:hypothetical protein
LQELAKQKAAGAGGAADDNAMASMEEMMKNALENPDYMNTMGDFGDALQQMMQMSPEDLAAQMEQAMKMMMDGDIVENIVNQKDEVIKSLEASGVVTPEELERYKTDPAYFELKMRESFAQMGDLFQNPEYIAKAAEALKDMTSLMEDPSAMQNVMQALVGNADLQDAEKLEEARLQFLSGDFGGMPGFKEAFETPEMQEILNDPVKWRETVKEGIDGVLGGAASDGAKDEL